MKPDCPECHEGVCGPHSVENWREVVKDIAPTRICPTCKEEAVFGQVFYVGVAGFVQECRSCRYQKAMAIPLPKKTKENTTVHRTLGY